MITLDWKNAISRFLAFLIFFPLMTTVALADGARVALVIGNSGYADDAYLPNAISDAALVQGAFLRIGFEVDLVEDLSFDDSVDVFSAFERKAASAEIALIYYAGHGMALSGENYLIPVDADISNEAQVIETSITLGRLQEIVAQASSFGVVLFDACRTNPWINEIVRNDGSLGANRGLVGNLSLPPGVIVGFSAQPGRVAYDGGAENGPYAIALNESLRRHPDMEIAGLLRSVGRRVQDLTGNQQLPIHTETLLPPQPMLTGVQNTADGAGTSTLGATSGNLMESQEGGDGEQSVVPVATTALQQITDCDRQAGYTWRPRIDGVGRSLEDINFEEALQTCHAAIVDYPEELFFYILAARALSGIDPDDPRVLTYMRRGAEADAGFALDRMARIALFGYAGTVANRDLAFMLSQLAAESGYPQALINMGDLFRDEAPTDTQRALQLFQQAQAAGLPEASAKIAWHMMNHAPTKPDYSEVRRLYEIAAAEDFAWATNNLGVMDRRGQGLSEPSAELALARFEQACASGHALACRNAGDVLTNELGNSANFLRAELFYRESCENGNAHGCFGLGWLNEQNRVPMAEPERAIELYTRACEQHVAGACNNLGNMLNSHDSGDANVIEVAELWEKACALGDRNGCRSFARRLEHFGGIVRPNLDLQNANTEAVAAYERACSLSNRTACVDLGRIYWNGDLDVEADYDTAASYYLQGCDLGNRYGCLHRARLARYEYISIDEDPLSIIETLCTEGHARSCRYLGEFLASDAMSLAALRNAHEIVERACALGEAASCFYLTHRSYGAFEEEWSNHSIAEYILRTLELDGNWSRIYEFYDVPEEERNLEFLFMGLGDAPEIAREIQAALADRGLYSGAIDGVFGPQSRQALVDLLAE